jgi:ABC-2 type transport system permease protein
MTNFILKLVSLFRKIYESGGINFDQLLAILRVKLMMDNRRQNASLNRGMQQKKETNNRFVMILVSYIFLGGLLTVYVVLIDSVFIATTILHTFIMVMLAMTLITDYSAVLLDTADSMILLPRPVDSRTLFAARLTHIALYVGLITLSVSIVPMIVIAAKFGAYTWLVFMFTLVMNALFTLFFTSLVYLLLMKFTSEERLKDILNYVQIGVAIFIFAFYQLMPRILNMEDLQNIQFEPSWWNYLIPTMWMAGTIEAFTVSGMTLYNLPHIVLCLIVPIFGLWVMNKYFATVFNQKLQGLSMELKTPAKDISLQGGPSVSNENMGKPSLMQRLSEVFTINPIERSAFQLVWIQVSRDRKIRLRLYPQFAYVFVLLFVFMFSFMRREEDFATAFENIKNQSWYLFLIYFGSTVLSTSMVLIPYSDDFKAAWVYYAIPIQKPGDILVGALKAQITKLFLPFYLILAIIILAVWGLKALDDIVFGFFNIMILSLISALIMKPLLPFSEQGSTQEQSGNFIRGLLTFTIFGVIAFIHYLFTRWDYMTLIGIPFQILIIYFLIKKYRDTPWINVNYASV